MNAQNLKTRLQIFEAKPDDALEGLPVLMAVLDISRSKAYREMAAGRIPKPRKCGRSSKWTVGTIRALARGAA